MIGSTSLVDRQSPMKGSLSERSCQVPNPKSPTTARLTRAAAA